jgi:mannose-1-phosphate guanylyltransferase/phosphomannomutase
VLDPDGEHLTLIDDEGHVLTDDESLFAMVSLVGGHLLGDQIAVPISTSRIIEQLAAENGVKIRYTKTSTAALMDAACDPGVGFAASGDGGFILPGFLPAFDAAATLVKLLELLAKEGALLSSIVAKAPRAHVVHDTVVTPWDRKGLVMRTLVEQTKDRQVDLVDGVKVWHDTAWILALPDAEEPLTHLWAEADSDAEARRLIQEYARRIRQLVR